MPSNLENFPVTVEKKWLIEKFTEVCALSTIHMVASWALVENTVRIAHRATKAIFLIAEVIDTKFELLEIQMAG
jgi:hypothetical protein